MKYGGIIEKIELRTTQNSGGAIVTVKCHSLEIGWSQFQLVVTDAESVCVGDPVEFWAEFPLQQKRLKASGR